MFDDLFKADVVFGYGGRGPKIFDCFGLAAEVRRRVGKPIFFDVETPNSDLLRRKELENGKTLFTKLEKPEPFCLVALSIHDTKYVDHVGVVWKNNYEFIHISENMRVSIDRLDSLIWKSKIRGFYT